MQIWPVFALHNPLIYNLMLQGILITKPYQGLDLFICWLLDSFLAPGCRLINLIISFSSFLISHFSFFILHSTDKSSFTSLIGYFPHKCWWILPKTLYPDIPLPNFQVKNSRCLPDYVELKIWNQNVPLKIDSHETFKESIRNCYYFQWPYRCWMWISLGW